MVLVQNYCCRPCLLLFRKLYIYSVLRKNHYKVLGLKPTATQSEIKSAYYELSKKHHPDKNQGSETSARLFRNITAAYEILGNEKLRKKYDESHRFDLGANSSGFRSSQGADYNDDVERMYYERRHRQAKKRYYYGKSAHYDFDAWYRGHYGKNSFSDGETWMGRSGFSEFDKWSKSDFQRSKTFGSKSRTPKQAIDDMKKSESFLYKTEICLMFLFYSVLIFALFNR